jgi:hypothetical protein
MSTQFTPGPTRDVEPGDTPDLNDGLLSRSQAAENIARGVACYLVDGDITIGTTALAATGVSPFVPIQSVDNSGGSAGDTEMSGVVAPQRVALTFETITAALTLFPGDYVKISTTVPGIVNRWLDGVDAAGLKYARFLGIEAALLDKNAVTPFDETLTPGIVPDQSVTGTNAQQFVGWFQLVENPGA